ncbi:MAG TPA: glycosyltransferase, partial [Candidatus Polarisedimenticolia bacterium]|nr:glycosyltransferase [Candidatus Polarisedimenticolia bacterium]
LFLARGQRQRGRRAVVVAPPTSELLKRAAAEGIEAIPFAGRGEWDLAAGRRLARLVEATPAALVHAHTAHAAALLLLAHLFGGRARGVVARRVSFPIRPPVLGRVKYAWRVDRVIAVSEAIRRALLRQGLAPARVAVVHSGIDAARFAAGRREPVRAHLLRAGAFPSDALLVGTVGHLAAHKGIDRFLEAAALFARAVPGARFVVVGRGAEEQALRGLAARLGLDGRVLFAGFRDDLPDLYAALDLFALASISGEGSPAVLKEAMAAGVPVVATSLDGVEEIIEDARHGLLTPPGDTAAMARALERLAADPSLRDRLSDAGRRRAAEFSIERMVEKTEAVYASLGVPV